MVEWKEVKLSDVAEIVGGATPSTKDDENYTGGNIAWITPKDLSNFTGRYISEGERCITEKGYNSCSTQMLPKHSVLFSSRAPIGYVAISDRQLCTNQGFKSAIPGPNIDYLFLYYLLKFKKDAIESMGSGTTFKEVSGNVMKNVLIEIPVDIDIQKKIACILDKIDSKIENNNSINRNLEEQALLLFKSWFLDYEPYSNVKPETWEDGVLGDFVTIKRGGSPRPIQEYLTDKGLRWLKISDVTSLSSPFVIDIAECIKESGLKKTVFLKAGSLVLSNSATPGVPKILDVDSCIHDGWLYFTESQFSNEFLYLYFKHIRRNLVALGNGSVFTNLKTDILKGYPTVKPERNVLEEFDSIVFPMFEEMRRIARENHKLSELRDSLLPRLMSGELDVSDLDI